TTKKIIKACIPMHTFGHACKIEDIKNICDEWNITLVEDAAESLGSYYKEKHTGTFGKLGAFSFNGNKIITFGGGGVIVTDDEEFAKKAKHLTTTAKTPHKWEYVHDEIGYNYRMSNVLAGIGRGQMEVLEDRINKRRDINRYYYENLSQINGIHFLKEPSSDYFSNYWLTTILVDPSKTKGITREDVRLALLKENIDSRPLWKPMHLQPVFKDYISFQNGVSEKLFINGLCLPSGSNMTENELRRILEAVIQIVSK
ncbi:MAG: DegT/DnrJ/EryC1/StrS family aminotransferase, partial [Bacteroidales bacterium]|nr:DegT/DnrJ/EryC1/StrS family aminotransferase [Bacteroidales bacterium]